MFLDIVGTDGLLQCDTGELDETAPECYNAAPECYNAAPACYNVTLL